jgi:hypothetical protein
MANTEDTSTDHRQQVRIPAELAAWLKDRAKENCRSINSELVICLKTIRKQEQEEQGYVA